MKIFHTDRRTDGQTDRRKKLLSCVCSQLKIIFTLKSLESSGSIKCFTHFMSKKWVERHQKWEKRKKAIAFFSGKCHNSDILGKRYENLVNLYLGAGIFFRWVPGWKNFSKKAWNFHIPINRFWKCSHRYMYDRKKIIPP